MLFPHQYHIKSATRGFMHEFAKKGDLVIIKYKIRRANSIGMQVTAVTSDMG